MELRRLLASIRSVLDDAIACGGTSVRDYVDAGGRKGGYQHRLKVYRREGLACLRCGRKSGVVRSVQSGRSTFYCPRCQR